MKKQNKKNNNTSVVISIIIMLVLLLGVIAVFVWDLISRIQRTWTNNDTITIVFFVMIAIAGSVVIKNLHDYFISNNKDVICLNNDIYRLFLEMETNGSIKKYEKLLIDRNKKRYLDKICSIIQKKNKNAVVTVENIGEHFFEPYGFYKGKACRITASRLESLYKKFKSNKSIGYEKLYRNVHSGDLIKNIKFPLFESIIPFLIGFAGMFSTIYNTLAIDGSIQESLMEYLKLFGSVIIFSLGYTFLTYESFKEGAISLKTNTLSDLEKCNCDNEE